MVIRVTRLREWRLARSHQNFICRQGFGRTMEIFPGKRCGYDLKKTNVGLFWETVIGFRDCSLHFCQKGGRGNRQGRIRETDFLYSDQEAGIISQRLGFVKKCFNIEETTGGRDCGSSLASRDRVRKSCRMRKRVDRLNVKTCRHSLRGESVINIKRKARRGTQGEKNPRPCRRSVTPLRYLGLISGAPCYRRLKKKNCYVGSKHS